MARSGATAARAAERFYRVSLLGLVASAHAALVGSGYIHAWPVLAGLHLLLLLAVFLIFKAKPVWAHAVKALALAELLAAALLSASAAFFLFLGAFLSFLVATQASEEILRAARGRFQVARGELRGFYWRLGTLIAIIALVIPGVTSGLFFVLPRTAHAAFSRLASERYHLPGFSAEVRLGQIGSILDRGTPAMHVRIVGAAGPMSIKWRGAALSSFDGKRWTAPVGPGETIRVDEDRSILADDDQRRLPGRRITYEVQLEAINSNVLFLAGVPEVLWIASPSITRAPGAVYRLGSAPAQRLRYGAISYLDAPRPQDRPGDAYLQLPAVDGRIRALALEATSGYSSDEAKAAALESYLRSNFGYTTGLPSSEPSDPLAYFLFDRKRGHCEYFATSMAVMLRTLGIPSRLVTGFHGGVLNPVTGWYVVRASDAHAWVEAWTPKQGWMTYDPTPSAPRAGEGSRWARLLFYTDAAELFWQNWVVNYDLGRQVTLASRMGNSGLTFGARFGDRIRLAWLQSQAAALEALRRYGLILLSVLAAAAVLRFAAPPAAAWWNTRRRLRKVHRGEAVASDATLLYVRMLDILKRRGFPKPAWLTPAEFARTLPPSGTAELVAGLTTAYHQLRYGEARDAAPRMAALLQQLERLT